MNLLTFRRTLDWLSNLITGDEKWVLYVNHTRKKQWLGSGQIGVPTPKPESHPKKVLLSVWWGIKGVIHREQMPSGTTNLKFDQKKRSNWIEFKVRSRITIELDRIQSSIKKGLFSYKNNELLEIF